MKKFLLKQYEKVDPNLRRLAGYLPAYKHLIGGAIFFMMTAAASSSLVAMTLGKLTDLGFYEQAPWIVIAAPIGLIFIAMLHGGSMFMSNFLLGKASQALLLKLREQLFENILRWPATAYTNNSTGLVASKFVNEANVALSSAAKSSVILIRDSIQVVSLTCVLVWHDITLTLVTLLIAPAIIYLLRYISKRLKGIMASAQQNIATLLARVKESYEAHSVIKISNAYDFEISRFREINDVVRNLALRMTKIGSIGNPATQLIGMAGVAVVLTVALIQAQAGLLTLGEFVTFLTAMLLILPPLRRLSSLNATFVGMAVAAGSIFATLDEPHETDNGTQTIDRARGEVTFENVTLRYPGTNKDAVSNFSLTVEPGMSVALVGTSGSGKTSLVNMIPRFWNPTSGRILLDGVPIDELTLESLRRQIAIVSQDVILFDDTIRGNISYGTPGATDEEIMEAVKAAALTEFIESLPQGLDTPVGEAGGRLSGGQKQRISIARALLRNTPILILDEATSALDAESEARIKVALEHLMKDRTTFIVAHRLSTVEKASLIVVMQNGTIQETGTHAELLAADGQYARLCRLQGLKGSEAVA
ncbi:lipid A export permease/ATP-binding protein MsbA [Sutterella sp.]|uniref:lipid A export permease/ATP-binding protein MsbA n=1 Tax=Sutterella sp. TaxID=1981025 RepID=UPI0026DFAEA0|nr:lipid A export permease/ATP-binding protein MsbA [Sutterella sp.]MDO5531360.1 lipid A export permease/ATP-binding protein MsbA [Sutterella sp.]